MRLARVSVLFAFVELTYARDFVWNLTENTNDGGMGRIADKFADELLDPIQDSMSESLKVFKVLLLHKFGLDRTTLAKPAHLSSRPASADKLLRNHPHRLLTGKPTFGGMRLVTWGTRNRAGKRFPATACFACLLPNANLESTQAFRAAFLPSKNRYRSLCVTLTLGCSIVGYTAYQSNLSPVLALSLWMLQIGFVLHWFQLYKTWVGTVDVASSVIGTLTYFIILCKVSVLAVIGHLLFMVPVLLNFFVNLQQHPYTQRQTYMHWLQHCMGTLTNLHFIYWARIPDLLSSTAR